MVTRFCGHSIAGLVFTSAALFSLLAMIGSIHMANITYQVPSGFVGNVLALDGNMYPVVSGQVVIPENWAPNYLLVAGFNPGTGLTAATGGTGPTGGTGALAAAGSIGKLGGVGGTGGTGGTGLTGPTGQTSPTGATGSTGATGPTGP